jgi:hypothetical protein
MGDGATVGNLLIATSAGCKDPRPAGARGACYSFQYVAMAPYTRPGMSAMCSWAGLFFQYPDNNWGLAQGLDVPISKLHQMTAQVAVGAGNELMTFRLGGIGNPLPDGTPGPPPGDACPPPDTPPLPNYDVVDSQLQIGVGTDWQKIVLPIVPRNLPTPPGDTIKLIGAFAWAVPATSGEPLPKTVYVDDLFFE